MFIHNIYKYKNGLNRGILHFIVFGKISIYISKYLYFIFTIKLYQHTIVLIGVVRTDLNSLKKNSAKCTSGNFFAVLGNRSERRGLGIY